VRRRQGGERRPRAACARAGAGVVRRADAPAGGSGRGSRPPHRPGRLAVRALALLGALLVLAVVGGTARADTFAVVPSTPFTAPTLTPNVGLAVPADLSSPPATPVTLSYAELLALWQRAGAAYGIPWQVLASINKVESNFGRNMGPSSAGAI